MKRLYACYLRCSTKHNITGLDSQKNALESHLERLNVKPDEYVIYEDKAISGAKDSRPGLNQMMEDVRDGKIHTVLVCSFSRFARSTKHLLDALNEFNELGVDFVSLSEAVDTSTSIGKLVFTMVSAIAQFERELAQGRVLRGLETARLNGKKLGRPKKRNSELIQKLLIDGMTYREISDLTGVSHWGIAQEVKLLRNLEIAEQSLSKKNIAL